jgi:hypothetical protein
MLFVGVTEGGFVFRVEHYRNTGDSCSRSEIDKMTLKNILILDDAGN